MFNAVWETFKKITPFILLIVFISYGVAIMTGNFNINQYGQIGDSYLYHLRSGNISYYEYDFAAYINGLQFKGIFTAWESTADKIGQLIIEPLKWDKDHTLQSLLNAIIMLINIPVILINLLVINMTQLLTQTITMILRILGQQVNINSQFWLSKTLYNINNWTGIPTVPYVTW